MDGSRSPKADRLVQSYARWRSNRLGKTTDWLEQELLFDLLGPVTGKVLLDVGCGDGFLASQLAQRGARVIGLDADPAMVAAARLRDTNEAHLLISEGWAEQLPFADSAFDLVLSVTVLCLARDAERAVGEMARVLKPGGRLVIGELGRSSLWSAYRRIRSQLGDPIWQTAKFRTMGDLRGLVAAAGLDVVAMRGAVRYPPCWLAAKMLAPVDLWLSRRTTFGAAFLAVSAQKPFGQRPGAWQC